MSTSTEHTQAPILGVILAGGRGERLGRQDKALIELNGQPLIAHVARAFAPQVSAIAITRQNDQAELDAYGVVITDGLVDEGPLAGVVEAARYAKANNFDYIATVAVDSTDIPPDLVAKLWSVRAPHAVVASHGRLQPTFSLYDLGAMDAIFAAFAAGERAPKHALIAAGVGRAELRESIFNVNTLDDLVAMRTKNNHE